MESRIGAPILRGDDLNDDPWRFAAVFRMINEMSLPCRFLGFPRVDDNCGTYLPRIGVPVR